MAVERLTYVYKISAEMMRAQNIKITTSTTDPAWWDRSCHEAKTLKYSLLRRFRITNNYLDFKRYVEARNHFKSICSRKKAKFLLNKRQTLINSSNNPTDFWRVLRMRSENRSTACTIGEDNFGKWLIYFKKLLYNSDYVNLNQKQWEADDILDNHDIILNSPIRESEVRKSIGKLKNGKAPGKDGISAEFYKHTCHIATPILALIFNEIFNSGTFPKSWCESILVPIYKSGSHDDPSNYRGISLINVMYKIFSSILNDRIYHWADSFEPTDKSQAGFRAGYSVLDNLFTLKSMIQKYIGKAGGRFYVLYVDSKKAFDSIVHDKLFNILLKRGKMFYILLDMYSNLRGN